MRGGGPRVNTVESGPWRTLTFVAHLIKTGKIGHGFFSAPVNW